MKLIAKTLFIILAVSTLISSMAMARQIRCYSNANAPAYHHSSGLWILEAKVASDFRLKDVVLKNRDQKRLNSEIKNTSYDRRIPEVRSFKLGPDIFCNYDVAMPREFSKEKSFQASLTMTCDNMYDADTKMTCVASAQ